MLNIHIFWARQGDYQPCGMFTKQHAMILILCLAFLALLLIASRSMSRETVTGLVRILSILMVVLELIKISYNFFYGYTWIDAWLPIAFCSIFLYALLLSGFGSERLKGYGDAYLTGTSMIAGVAYLIFPSTSLMLYPVWHYLSLHSMVFHTLMIYVGILYLWKLKAHLNWMIYFRFVTLYAIFAMIALFLNLTTGSNLMLMREPFKIPIAFLHSLYAFAPWAYTMVVIMTYLIVPFSITYGIEHLIYQGENSGKLEQKIL